MLQTRGRVDPGPKEKIPMLSFKKGFTFLLLFFIFLYSGCDWLNESKIESGVYTHSGIGWEMTLPPGWKTNSASEVKKLSKTGIEMMETANDQKIRIPSYELLLNLKKDKFNLFASSLQDYDPEYDGNLVEFTQRNEDMIEQTFTHQNVNFEKRKYQQQIGSVNFEAFEFLIYQTPKKRKILFHQSFYFGVVGDQLMNVNANATTREGYNELIDAFHSSKLNPTP